MSGKKVRHSPIRRILVALDASVSSLNAMQAAVDLAARFDAEVLGLFVEDINLLRLTELPFAREISFYFPRPRRIRPLEMELQLRTQAIRIRNRLAQIADQYGVPWTFRTARGDVGAEVLSAGADADLVILGKIGRSLPGMQRSGSTVRSLLMQRQGMTLILQTRIQFVRTPVVAVYDGTPAAQKALDTAVYLVQTTEAPLIVFIVAGSPENLEQCKARAGQQLQAKGVEARFRRFVQPTLTGLAARIRDETSGPVVIPCLEDWFEGEKLCGLVDEIANPVLLIR